MSFSALALSEPHLTILQRESMAALRDDCPPESLVVLVYIKCVLKLNYFSIVTDFRLATMHINLDFAEGAVHSYRPQSPYSTTEL